MNADAKTVIAGQILALAPTDRVEIHRKIQDASWWATDSMPVDALQQIITEWVNMRNGVTVGLPIPQEYELPHNNC